MCHALRFTFNWEIFMRFWIAICLVLTSSAITRGDILITEAHPTGSSSTTYARDWFELTNTGPAAVDITGWKVDDSSNSFALALALTDVTSINSGKSVVFIEGSSIAGENAVIANNFIAAWFGGSAPSGFQIGFYTGSGIGLSSGGDAVNIFNAGGTRIAGVDFGAATPGVTFDNAAGINISSISTLSVAGVNGAFASVTGGEIGSPGVIPEPSTASFLGLVGLGLLLRRRVS
jgi:hypothetical protein